MRFMILMYPDPAAETGADDDAKNVGEMMKYNEALAKAGVLLESKETLGGYWLIEVKSREEAIEWAKRCPAATARFIDVRQMFELTDYTPDVQELAGNPAVRASLGQSRAG